jgi:hypothetical protein
MSGHKHSYAAQVIGEGAIRELSFFSRKLEYASWLLDANQPDGFDTTVAAQKHRQPIASIRY